MDLSPHFHSCSTMVKIINLLKLLQRLSIDPSSQQVTLFLLASNCTVVQLYSRVNPWPKSRLNIIIIFIALIKHNFSLSPTLSIYLHHCFLQISAYSVSLACVAFLYPNLQRSNVTSLWDYLNPSPCMKVDIVGSSSGTCIWLSVIIIFISDCLARFLDILFIQFSVHYSNYYHKL